MIIILVWLHTAVSVSDARIIPQQLTFQNIPAVVNINVLSLCLSPRMMTAVGIAQVSGVQMCVNLGGGDVRMTQQLLD